MGTFTVDLPARFGLDPKDNQSDYTPAQSYYQSAKQWCEAADEEAKMDQGQQEESQYYAKYVDYIIGKQWPGQRPSFRSSPVDNRIWGLFWELVATLTDIRPVFAVKSTSGDSPPLEHAADMITKSVRSWWMEADADMQLALIIIYGLLSTGYAKLTWNEELRNGFGDFDLLALGPSEVLPLKPRTTLDSAQAVIYKTPQPLGWFKRFGAVGKLVKPDPAYSRYEASPARPGHMPNMQFDLLSPQMKRIIGGPQKFGNSAYPAALYREFWLKDYSVNTSNGTVIMGDPRKNWSYEVKPTQPLYPRGRLICMGGDVIVHDGPNPYWHGMFPFVDFRMNVVPWQFMGLSEIRPMVPLQDIINNVLAGVLDMIKKAVNPSFMAPKQAASESMWQTLDWGMPGAKFAYNANAPGKPEFMPAPNLPAFVLQMMQIASREMDRSSGIAAVSQAVQKKQVPSGESLDQIQKIQQTPLRLKGRNIEIGLRGLGRRSVWNTFQFYTQERLMYMYGKSATEFSHFTWNPKKLIPPGETAYSFARNFSFLISPGSLLDLNKVERSFTVMRLRMMRDIDRRSMYKELDMGVDIDAIEAALDEEAKKQAATGAPALGPGKIPKRGGRM